MVLQLYQIKYIFFIPAYAHLPAWIVVAGEQKSYLFLFLYVVYIQNRQLMSWQFAFNF